MRNTRKTSVDRGLWIKFKCGSERNEGPSEVTQIQTPMNGTEDAVHARKAAAQAPESDDFRACW